MIKKALFPGIFDPPTSGHVELIKRASNLFERLYIGVVDKSGKRPCVFSPEERCNLLKQATAEFNNVEIVLLNGLVVDSAKKFGVNVLIRGLRNGVDLDYEYQMALANYQMINIETLFLATAPQYGHLSSTLIREIASHGRRLHGFVPDCIEDAIFQKLSRK